MKKLLCSFALLVLLSANAVRGDDLPYFSSIRQEIVVQLTTMSNNPPVDRRLVSTLGANLKLIDRTKPTFITGSASLGTLAKSLGKTTLSNTFLPIVGETRETYRKVIRAQKSLLEERLVATIPGRAQTAAQTALNKVSAPLDGVATNSNLTLSLKSLTKAAISLAAAEKAVAKAETTRPGSSFLTATINESNQKATKLVVTKDMLEAYYDPIAGEIQIEAAQLESLGRGRHEVRGLSLTAMVSSDGTHSLSLTNDTDGYALYGRAIVRNINAEEPKVEEQESYFTIDPINQRLGTGTMTITVDQEANLVWGTFTFTANGSENTSLAVSVTGSFLVRPSTYEEFE